MKILLINKFYYLKGGAEKHFFGLKKILEDYGHKVIVFSMRDPKNLPSPYEKYFVSKVDFEHVRFNWQGLRTAGRMLYSFEAKRKIAELLDVEKPDIVHLHNIYHQLSPSILPEIKKRGIPVVQTLHDYKLLSPNYALYCQGKICERCRGGKYYNCLLHRCIKNSYVASGLSAVEMYFHKARKYYENNVDAFICPSQFMASQLRKWNIKAKRIEQLYNFTAETGANSSETKNYLLFVGRLSEEKGAEILINAMEGIKTTLKIIGTGPLERSLRELVKNRRIGNVELLGYKEGAELQKAVDQSLAIIVPSQWYENCPLVILEAFQAGKAVIATRIGGIPELVRDGETGFVFEIGSVEDMKNVIRQASSDLNKLKAMGERARQFSKLFKSDLYYNRLMTIYESLANKK